VCRGKQHQDGKLDVACMATAALAQLLLAMQEAPPPPQHLLARLMYMYQRSMRMAVDMVITKVITKHN
jgi:hypothetical protein